MRPVLTPHPHEDVLFKEAAPVDAPEARYKRFSPGTRRLPTGSRHARGAARLRCDIINDKDVALVLRDGATIFADVFRPDTDSGVPAVVNWAPYGKGGTGYQTLDRYPNRFGVSRSALSGLQSWEGNDPDYWCSRGYAVVQVDARGAFDSEGSIFAQGTAEGRDGHDAVEAIAALPWCSGKVGLAGNSWLAMAQWFIAAQRPPHLAAIAPWEGANDIYRQALARGGVPETAFVSHIFKTLYGRSQIEDIVGMLAERPLFDDYWADKVPDVASIHVPAYVVGSYTHPLHSDGTLKGWADLKESKWLRIHNTMEWPDFYDPANVEDLRRFFDRFLLDIDNDWEATPTVRYSVLDPGHTDTVGRPAEAFPPPESAAIKYYLDARTRTLSTVVPEQKATASYKVAAAQPWIDFVHKFTKDTEVVGWPVIELYLEVEGHDDADLHIYLQKLDERGRESWHQTTDLGLPLGRCWMPLVHRLGVKGVAPAFYQGADGVVRLSRRGLDPNAPEDRPELSLRAIEPLAANEPTRVEVPIWPIGMRWHRNEVLRVRISAVSLLPDFVSGLPMTPRQPGERHLFATGPQHPASLTLPILNAISRRPAVRAVRGD